jgi:DNA-binding beta-propeller fold protein YncE
MRNTWFAIAMAACLSLGVGVPGIQAARAEDVVELWRNPFGNPQAVAVNAADGSCWVSMGMSVTHVAADGSVLGQHSGFIADLIAVNPGDGSLWVATWTGGPLIHLAADGTELWSGDGYHAYDISVDSTDGSCWVADPQNGLVHVAADGSVLLRVTSLVRPGRVAANSADGSCWVVDNDRSRVAHISATGDELWSSWGPSQTESIAVNPTDGSCWVAGEGSPAITHLKADGTVLWAAELPEDGRAIAVNSTDGSCWVSTYGGSSGTSLVLHLSATGDQLWTSDASAFPFPLSLAVDSTDGSCWVADSGDPGRLVHLSADGTEVWSAPAQYAPWAVSASALDGSCWMANWSDPDLVHLAADGEELWSTADLGFVGAVAVNLADGSCWVAGNSDLHHLAADGTEVWSGALPQFPTSLAVNPGDGSCWAVTCDSEASHLVHVASDGTTLLDSTDIPRARYVSVDPADGSVWVSDQAYDSATYEPIGRVVHLSAGGEQLWEQTGLGMPGPLSVDIADGSVWTTDLGDGRIAHLAADGTELGSAEGYAIGWSTPSRVLAASPVDGGCWVSALASEGWSQQKIIRLSATGDTLWSGYVVCCPYGLGVNAADGSCWVSGQGSGQLVHLGIAGAEHRCYAVAYAPNPATVPSGGTTALGAFAADNLGHGIASWSWSDGGAGGTFSPSPNVPNPTYTAPVNHTSADMHITLTVTVASADDPPLTASASSVLCVRPEYLLQIARQGSGFARVNGVVVGLPYAQSLDGGEVVTVEAVPSVGWEFDRWTGDAESADTEITLSMDRDYSVRAEFALPPGTAYFLPVDYPEQEFAGWTGWASAPGSGWEWGAPLAGGGQPIGDGGAILGSDPGISHSGGSIIGYAIGGNYQAGMSPQYLTTPPLDFRGRQHVRLHFWRWLAVEDQAYDTAALEVNVGSGWQRLWTNPTGSPPTYIFDDAWTEVEYPMPQADGKAGVQVRWQVGGSDAWSSPTEYGGWSLDDISFQCDADRWSASDASALTALLWEEQAGLSAEIGNAGESTWDDSFGFQCLTARTPTGAWGVDFVPIAGTVAPTESYAFATDIMAPPVSTIAYRSPVEPSGPGIDATLACDWALGQEARGALRGEPLAWGITISRFRDIQPGTDGGWARFYVEELAGAVPSIVAGYGEGQYRPELAVTRDQMAVYIARAAGLDTSGATGDVFHDVPADWWAAGAIEACAAAGIVSGFPDSTYQPQTVVTRDAMCKFIANGRAYSDPGFFIPDEVTEAPFSDVPADHWAARWISACLWAGIVQGYGDGTYQPAAGVNRGQMAVFVWRAFLRDRDSLVVLGGPTISRYAPTAERYAVGSVTTAEAGETLHASVLLDAVRLTASPVTVRFELRRILSEDMFSPAGSFTVTLDGSQVSAAHGAALASGNPYLPLTTALPTAGLEPGAYLLMTTINDSELARQAHLALTTPAP